MAKLGHINTLAAVRETQSGFYLDGGELGEHSGHSSGPVLKLRELSGHPWRSVVG